MNNVCYDIKMTKDVFTQYDDGYKKYDKIYNSSNDSYQSIISNFDIREKNVLSVIGSGDQAFHLYKSGAKVVDLFDINKLTIYYYFLRVWGIKQLGKPYPPYNFDNQYIQQLLSNVIPTSDLETMAYEYWNMYIKTYQSCCNWHLFGHFPISEEQLNLDVSDLCEKINNQFNFYNIDITKSIEIDRKYDVIYTSNISEFIQGTKNYQIYRDNLDKLLEKDGVILSSRLMRPDVSTDEKIVMCQKFKLERLPEEINKFGFVVSPGYCYKKRRFRKLF